MQKPSDVAREERLEQLFHQALALPLAERADHVTAAAEDDRLLLAELLELLDAHAGAPQFLEDPVVTPERLVQAETGVKPGTRLGPYVLQRLLGEGGMGAVYLADQDSPLQRRVAIKLIKPGMDTREVLARFEGERRVLARLSHPHIAAVHDAGSTPLGRPFFVMEYVDGERLGEYCDRRELPLEARLAIFAQVCDAVHHAHCQGVIHRDLTPGNVLVQDVGGVPVPKIIDFGVAKAIDGSGREGTLCTRGGQLIGTPGYMSPEQAAGSGQVDSRSDVYSLGVLLQELLIGLLPVDRQQLADAGSDQALRELLVSGSNVPPSQALARAPAARARRLARRRGLETVALTKRLRGDLDWIVMRALQVDVTERYASAAALAADLRRHLANEPVSAGPPGLVYRVRKLAAAHRGAAVGACAVLLAGLASTALLGWSSGVEEGSQATLAALGLEPGSVLPGRPLEESAPAPAAALQCEDCLDVPNDTVGVVNAERRALAVGELVELRSASEVGLALAGSGHAVLGPVAGVLEEQAGHRHLVAAPVAAGARAEVVVRGPWALLSVVGPVRPDQGLTVAARPGQARAALPGEPLLGHATLGARGAGPTLIKAFIAPSWPQDLAALNGDPDSTGGVLSGGVTGHQKAQPLLAEGGSSSGAPIARGAGGGDHPGSGGAGGGVPPNGTESGTGGHGVSGMALAGRQAPVVSSLTAGAYAPGVLHAPGSVLDHDLRVGDHGGDGLSGVDQESLTKALDSQQGKLVQTLQAEQSWGDADGDGLVDVLSAGPGGTRLLRNLGQGLFEDVTAWSGIAPELSLHAVQWVDLGGDGLTDLLALDADGAVLAFLGLGAAQFAEQATPMGLVSSVPVVDLELVPTGPGTPPDVSLVLADGALLLLHNDGLGSFSAVELIEGGLEAPAVQQPGQTGDGPQQADDDLLTPAAGGGTGGALQGQG